jgi:hypothetical protein
VVTFNKEQTEAVVTNIREKIRETTPVNEHPEGTIIRVKRVGQDGKTRTYAFIYESGSWWSTAVSRAHVHSRYNNQDFMEFLAASKTTKVEVAAAFEVIKRRKTKHTEQ